MGERVFFLAKRWHCCAALQGLHASLPRPPPRCASHCDTSAMPRTCAECGCLAPTCSHNLPQLATTCPRRSTVRLRLVPFTLAVPLFPPAHVDVYAPAAEPYSVGSLAADAQRRKARAVGAAALGKGARRSERCCSGLTRKDAAGPHRPCRYLRHDARFHRHAVQNEGPSARLALPVFCYRRLGATSSSLLSSTRVRARRSSSC